MGPYYNGILTGKPFSSFRSGTNCEHQLSWDGPTSLMVSDRYVGSELKLENDGNYISRLEYVWLSA